MKECNPKLKKWTHKMKVWTMKYYPLSEKDNAYGILPSSTTFMEDPIGATWDGKTQLLVTMTSTLLQSLCQRRQCYFRIFWIPYTNQHHHKLPSTVLNTDSRLLVKNSRLQYEKSCSNSINTKLLIQRILKT